MKRTDELKVFGNNGHYAFNQDSLMILEAIANPEFVRTIPKPPPHLDKKSGGGLSKVVINMTSTCNLSCRYCYANGGGFLHTEIKFLSVDSLRKIVLNLEKDQISRLEVLELFGGEPLSNRRMLKTVIKTMVDRFDVKDILLTTNGTMITPEVSSILTDNNAFVVVSLDGPPDVNDALRGQGSYRRATQGLALLEELRNRGRLGIASTFTNLHRKMGYSPQFLFDYFHKRGNLKWPPNYLTLN